MYRQTAHRSAAMSPNVDHAGDVSLLELPALLAERGISTLEVCHFHFPSVDDAYIAEFRAALADADVELYSLLVDTADITRADAAERAREVDTVRFWMEIAAKVGASHARVIAGDADIDAQNGDAMDHPTIRLSAENLSALARVGADIGVKVNTENFRALTNRAAHVLAILELCEGDVGLCADFGNYGGDEKYDELAAILPHANVLHAKADYPAAGEMAREDFDRCLDLARDAEFDGPYSLIFDGPGSEWDSLAQIQSVVEARIA
jgi:sugar phosphate isomerase/epimerase